MKEILQCYALLGITHTATPEEVKKAYRNLAKIWHPDRYTNNPAQKAKAEVEIKKINRAYATIKADPTHSIDRVVKQKKGYSSSKVSKKSTSPESFYQQGVAYAEQGEYQAALDSFAQAIKRNSDYLEAYQYRGFILSKLGYKLRADAEFKKAHQLKVKKSKTSDSKKTQVKTDPQPSSSTIKTQISQPLKCERTIIANNRSIDCIAFNSFDRTFASANGDR